MPSRPSTFDEADIDPGFRCGLRYALLGNAPGGAMVADSSGRKGHGTHNGATWKWDQWLGRYCLNLNGTSHVITTGFTFSNTAASTITYWFRPTTVDSNYRGIVFPASTSPPYYGTLFQAGNQGQWPDLGGGALGCTGITANNWYHYALTRAGNSVTGGFCGYLNGALKGTGNTGGDNPFSATLLIGNQNGQSRYYAGDIADVLIYDRVLTPGEVCLLANPNYDPVQPRRPVRPASAANSAPVFGHYYAQMRA